MVAIVLTMIVIMTVLMIMIFAVLEIVTVIIEGWYTCIHSVNEVRW